MKYAIILNGREIACTGDLALAVEWRLLNPSTNGYKNVW